MRRRRFQLGVFGIQGRQVAARQDGDALGLQVGHEAVVHDVDQGLVARSVHALEGDDNIGGRARHQFDAADLGIRLHPVQHIDGEGADGHLGQAVQLRLVLEDRRRGRGGVGPRARARRGRDADEGGGQSRCSKTLVHNRAPDDHVESQYIQDFRRLATGNGA